MIRNAFRRVLGHQNRASPSYPRPLQCTGMQTVPVIALECRFIAQFLEIYPALASEVALHGNS